MRQCLLQEKKSIAEELPRLLHCNHHPGTSTFRRVRSSPSIRIIDTVTSTFLLILRKYDRTWSDPSSLVNYILPPPFMHLIFSSSTAAKLRK